MYNDSLNHHGIKGMHWGERKYQYKDGSLTPAGRDHYNVGPPRKEPKYVKEYVKYASKYKATDKSQKRNYDKYINKGLSDKEAKAMAYRKERARRIMKIAAGVTVASLAGIAIAKHREYVKDVLLKNNVPIKRITLNPKDDGTHQIYAAFKKKDVKMYEGIYGKMLERRGGKINDVFQSTYKTNTAVKIAGHATGRNTINEMIKNDPKSKQMVLDLAEEFSKTGRHPNQRKAAAEAAKLIKKGKPLNSKAYDGLNIAMTMPTQNAYNFNTKLTNALKSKGYHGIVDVNDQKYSTFLANKPVILFEHNVLEKVSDVKMDSNVMRKMNKTESAKRIGRNINERVLKTPITALAVGSGIAAAEITDNVYEKKILDYRKEHPASTRSYTELLRAAKEGKL